MAVLVAFLWGAQVTAVKIGGQELPPILMVALRFIMMGLVLLPFCKLPARAQMSRMFAVVSMTGAVHFGLLYCGISMVDASTSAVVYQLSAPFTILLAFLVLGERIAVHVISGIALAFLGVLIVMGGTGKGGEVLGILLVIAAAFAFAVGTIMTKRWGPFHPIQLTAWTALIAAPELLLVSYLTEAGSWGTVGNASLKAWLAVVYTALSGGLVGFGLWYWLLCRHAVQKLSPFLLLVPVFAVGVSQVLLRETLTMPLVAGGIAVLAGIALCQLNINRKVRLEQQQPTSEQLS